MTYYEDNDRFLLELTLSTGREIHARSFHVSESYAELQFGSPNKNTNEWYLASTPIWSRQIHGDCPVLIITPDYRSSESGDPRFPWFRFSAKFGSFEPTVSRHMDASALTLVWFQDELHPPISDAIWPKLAAVDWDEHACEFDW